jgi:hypothetical protein
MSVFGCMAFPPRVEPKAAYTSGIAYHRKGSLWGTFAHHPQPADFPESGLLRRFDGAPSDTTRFTGLVGARVNLETIGQSHLCAIHDEPIQKTHSESRSESLRNPGGRELRSAIRKILGFRIETRQDCGVGTMALPVGGAEQAVPRMGHAGPHWRITLASR